MKQSLKITGFVMVIVLLALLSDKREEKLPGDKNMTCCSKSTINEAKDKMPGMSNKAILLPVLNFFDFN